METLEDRIREIPGEEGFWKRASEERFLKAGEKLRTQGWEDDQIVDFLEDLYWAVAHCFGH